jgi:hypothetical protein
MEIAVLVVQYVFADIFQYKFLFFSIILCSNPSCLFLLTMVLDGASAVIIVSQKFWKDYVKKYPSSPPPVSIIGYGEASGFLR